MKSIRKKIVLSNLVLVLFAVLFVSIPTLYIETKELKQNLSEKANLQLASARAEIANFLSQPVSIVNSMAAYVEEHDFLNKTDCQNMFANILDG